ncbi:MAG: sulfite exporter TauE/SafE family protein [Terriglobales bacterium]
MNIDATTWQVAGILFIATIGRSTFGFGEALLAVPLLALLIPVKVAVAVAALISTMVALIIVAQDWKHIEHRSAGLLLASTVFGIPLGLLLVKEVAEPVVKGVLALVILAFAVFSLVNRTSAELKDDRLAWAFGFAAGILGGAYAINGPPLVVYGALRRWSPTRFRATLQGYFLPGSALVVVGYWVGGLLNLSVLRYFLVSLPAVLVAILVGTAINRRLDAQRFRASLNVVLVIVGIALLAQAVYRG